MDEAISELQEVIDDAAQALEQAQENDPLAAYASACGAACSLSNAMSSLAEEAKKRI